MGNIILMVYRIKNSPNVFENGAASKPELPAIFHKQGIILTLKNKHYFALYSLKKEGIDFSSSNDPTSKKRTAANLPKDPNVAASQLVRHSANSVFNVKKKFFVRNLVGDKFPKMLKSQNLPKIICMLEKSI